MKTPLSHSEAAERNTLEWLENAYKQGNGGFPHSRWMGLPSAMAWNRDYSETTGYMIENLLEFNNKAKPGLSKLAELSGEWLLSIQSDSGCFHSGTKLDTPSVFNSAQILFGLDQLYQHTKQEKYFKSLEKAFLWLILAIDDDGIFKYGLYVNGYYPAYYSRAIWAMIKMDKDYFHSEHQPLLFKSLLNLFSNKNQYGFFDNAGFYPGKPAVLHTAIYTLEGFYESAILLQDNKMQTELRNILDRLCTLFHEHNKTPAYIYANFSVDFSFICVSGQAQLCALLLNVFFNSGKPEYKETAVKLFDQLLQWQIQSNSVESNGAFPSSIPIWGRYFPFRYTHWTMKFFLDACYWMKKID